MAGWELRWYGWLRYCNDIAVVVDGPHPDVPATAAAASTVMPSCASASSTDPGRIPDGSPTRSTPSHEPPPWAAAVTAAERPVREPGAGFELVLIVLCGLVAAAAAVTWLGARLALLVAGGDGSVSGGVSRSVVVAGRLLRGRSPAEAWGDDATGLPGPRLYWACHRRCRCRRDRTGGRGGVAVAAGRRTG